MNCSQPKTCIISWNLSSFHSKYELLQTLIYDFNPFAICLQETKLKSNHKTTIKNFDIYRQDYGSDHARGGVLIATSKLIQSERVNISSDLQAVAVRIHSKYPYTLCCVYLHQNNFIFFSYVSQV